MGGFVFRGLVLPPPGLWGGGNTSPLRTTAWEATSHADAPWTSISYPESLGYLASGWSPVETLGYWNLLPQDFWGETMEVVTELK